LSTRPKVIIFVLTNEWEYAVLQSSIHESWARTFCSTLETRLSYTPTDGFETYPLPGCEEVTTCALEQISKLQYQYRRQLMLNRQEGLTATYNRFHNPQESAADIARLRALHVEMDNAVAAAYGWSDLVLGHGFHETAQGVRYTISEPARREVLARLLALNHERYAEEVKAGLHEKKGKGKLVAGGKGPGKTEDGENGLESSMKQMGLFA